MKKLLITFSLFLLSSIAAIAQSNQRIPVCTVPTGLRMVNYTPNTVILGWDDPNNASEWEIEIIESSQTPRRSGFVVRSNPYQVANLSPGVEYKFYVRSLCATNYLSEWAGPSYFTLGCRMPRNVTFSITGSNGFVSWDSDMNSKWEVELAPADQNFTNSGTIVTANTHTFANIDPKKAYKVQVRSICATKNLTYTSDWAIKKCLSGTITTFQITNNPGNKDLCANETISFTADPLIIAHYWRIYDSNNNLIATFDIANPTFVFPQPGSYYCTLEARTAKCSDIIYHEFEVGDCGNKCFSGKIISANSICQGQNNYFYFSPDSSSPINYSDPTLQFEWSVTDVDGNPVRFEPVYLAGSSLPYYINVPFENDGEYFINLSVSNSKCKERFEFKAKVRKCECRLDGDINVKEEKICAGKKFSINFSNDQGGYTYEWNIVNSQNQNIYSTSGAGLSSFTTVINQPGTFTVLLTIRDKSGCVFFEIRNIKVENCGDRCLFGEIKNNSVLCADSKNFFWFVPDPSTPINYSDPELHFEWSVADVNGNQVSFDPVYLFGSSLAYYIIIPFGAEGEYTVTLNVSDSRCRERFEKVVIVPKECSCRGAEGNIKIKQEKLCIGKKIDLFFSNPQQGYTYSWNILNSQYQSVYSSTSATQGIAPVINVPGEYIVLLTVRDAKGCERLIITSIEVENCDDQCLFGEIKNNSVLCAGSKNFFWFVPDPSSPIDYTDPNLHFEWSVTDANGNGVPFEPVYLFGSSLGYYVIVPFDGDGQYTVSLNIITPKCRVTFNKTVIVSKECSCNSARGKIRIKQEKLCIGKKIDLYFSEPQPGYTYTWNILNSQYQSMYSSTGVTEGISTTITEAGEYTVILIIKDSKGCETLVITKIKVENCESNPEDPNCFYHLAFSYATPNSGSPAINNSIRLDLAKGITDFVNQNITGKLFITGVDDHSAGSRFAAMQNIITESWNVPYVNPSNEINGLNSVGNGLRIRIQDNDYANTATNLLNFIASSEAITMPIDVDFLIVSRDSNTSEIANSYSNLLNTGKAKKIFFILFEGGQYSLNGQNVTIASFMNQVINGSAVNFSQTNSIINSNYVVIPASIHQTPNITNYIKVFLQNAYNEVKARTVCNSNCLNGEISSSTSLCAGTDNFFWFNPTGTINFTDPTLQFTWTVTSNGSQVPFESINANNTSINLTNPAAGNYTITLVVSNSGCTKTIVRNVNIGRCTVASCGDSTNQYYVVGLFKELLKHLKGQPAGTITNGYSCPELIALLPYINPSIASPAIYNFTNTNNTIRFSFSASASTPHVVFNMPANNPSFFVALSLGNNYINMNNPTSFVSSFFVFSPFFPVVVSTTGSTVSQINFCPNQLDCINHIAIVLDESTSITSVDAGRIRGQLKKFIDQQVVFNQTKGSQLKISLIGLSDQDIDVRTDNIISMPVNPANKQTLINWANKYKSRYNDGLSGVSSNSDYWNSGLSRAAQTDASLVILITDGAQTGNVTTLKNTIALYNNANDVSQKHLYVIGLNNGYYIDSPTGSARYSETSNPNLVEEIPTEDEDEAGLVNFETSSETNRLTDFLRISLRALIYNNTQFPTEFLHDFTKDYSGHTNFKFLYDDPFYLSNGLYKFLGESCGEEQYLERCDDCDGVQLDPRQSYIISAWVHVDKTQQVTSFKEANQSPSIEIHFCNEGDIDADDANPDNPNSQHLADVTENGIDYQGGVEFFPQGNIIDGWQRIFGVFKVHPQTVYMKVILNNGSRSDAMHFDDIRIHPREGSMKSFVYDEQTYKLMSELDENNYSTYYEYDAEGGLVRVKKETERGIKTIQETRSGTIIKSE